MLMEKKEIGPTARIAQNGMVEKDAKVILFDCFGLFATDSVNDFFKELFGADFQKNKDRFCAPADRGEIGFEELVKGIAGEYHLDPSSLYSRFIAERTVNQEMIDFAKECRAKHHVYLLSNCIRGTIDEVFAGTDFALAFDGQFRSCDIGLVKPSPEIFAFVKQKLGSPKDIVFVDDNPLNVEAAKKAGIPGIVFTSLQQLRADLASYGY